MHKFIDPLHGSFGWPVTAIGWLASIVQQAEASMKRINEFMHTSSNLGHTGNLEPANLSGKIEFKNVSFAYDEVDVLKNINLEIPKGKKIALVGVSGSGKSTFIQLLLRFFDVTNGEILIDGKNIKTITQENLRALTGLVTQQTTLFNDTATNNIALGKEVDFSAIQNAATLANAADFIEKLPLQYETNIGDNGIKLSGGEQQRLTIARAIYKNAHLDSNSEKLVHDALQNLLQNKTAIIIAHRLSTVQFADEIVVLKDGNIIEQGSHLQLMQRNGEYKKLVDLQQL